MPRPLQKPHPPLWLASSGPETHELAGKMGLGLLAFTLLIGPEDLANRIALYHSGIKEAKPVGAFVNNQAATFALGLCAATNKAAKEAQRNRSCGIRAKPSNTWARYWHGPRS